MNESNNNYTFSQSADGNITIAKNSSSKESESISIPYEELLDWVYGLNNFLDSLGVKPILSKTTSSDLESSYMDQQKELHQSAYARWTPEADAELTKMFNQADFDNALAAEHFGRNTGAIQSRLKKLGLLAPPTLNSED